MVYAVIEQSLFHNNDLIKYGGPKTASQVYGLGVKIYDLALECLQTIRQDLFHKANVKIIQAYIKNLSAEKQRIMNDYKIALNSEISLFYQNKGLSLNEAGQISEDELKEIIYPILNFYNRKLYQLVEIAELINVYNENELLMICLEITDNLYSVFRQLSHLFPISELRPYFKEMAEGTSNLHC